MERPDMCQMPVGIVCHSTPHPWSRDALVPVVSLTSDFLISPENALALFCISQANS